MGNPYLNQDNGAQAQPPAQVAAEPQAPSTAEAD